MKEGLKKIIENSKRIARGLIVGGWVYSLACLGGNIAVASFPGEEISKEQAEMIIASELTKSYLQNKKIELDVVPYLSLPVEIEGLEYPSEGKYHIVQKEGLICKKLLLHELGHVILNNSVKRKIPLEDVINEVNNLEKTANAGDLLEYIVSPKELYCNMYSLVKNFEY